MAGEPSNLDASYATSLYDAFILNRTGAWLLQRAPDGSLVPYLAEKWDVSDDGLTYTFKLRDGVIFHNGDPLTAHDYVWTLQRAIEKNASASFALGVVSELEVVGDLSFVIRLREPFAPFLTMLASFGPYLQPLSPRAIEEAGDNYFRRPVGVGPFKFVDWQQGKSIRLARNEDFTWGPPFAHAGPAFIEFLEYWFIPEDSIRLAAVEKGEVHIGYELSPKDITVLERNGQFDFLIVPFTGLDPFVAINLDIPELQDIRVRQALNLGVDRESLVKIVLGGRGEPQFGPISPSVIGYWPGVEEIGYPYDVSQARTLLEEAGYVVNPDGIYEKDGNPLKFTLLTSNIKSYDILAAALADMWSAIGVQIEIELVESGILRQRVRFDGTYELGIGHIGYPDIDMLYIAFSSDGLFSGLSIRDPLLDEILSQTRTTIESAARQEWARKAQQYFINQAYLIPLYHTQIFIPVTPALTGVSVNLHHDIFLFDAHFRFP